MKMTEEEDKVYMEAFGKSKAKTVKERMSEAEAALNAWRKDGEMRAVNQGITEANNDYKLKNRRKRLDEAIDGSK